MVCVMCLSNSSTLLAWRDKFEHDIDVRKWREYGASVASLSGI
jgi:hypothetical protein